ncbi:hypothetical protein PHSY_006270 [Pseudozyma hubeiensis SY62]|uniref:Uncharacterized protein n=1 Tax=Pseudozyma hubeiensis (strain SY62) TaxID=1305764 RepID=R9PBC3_PSEHS|nr:hypothetical protein PHSY_006270 [Pseudozyma hubeiensis SY62]GAC98676.1 hypothetical protein PHSY_006270 [Pseudozyma hubeiensis SY62]
MQSCSPRHTKAVSEQRAPRTAQNQASGEDGVRRGLDPTRIGGKHIKTAARGWPGEFTFGLSVSDNGNARLTSGHGTWAETATKRIRCSCRLTL